MTQCGVDGWHVLEGYDRARNEYERTPTGEGAGTAPTVPTDVTSATTDNNSPTDTTPTALEQAPPYVAETCTTPDPKTIDTVIKYLRVCAEDARGHQDEVKKIKAELEEKNALICEHERTITNLRGEIVQLNAAYEEEIGRRKVVEDEYAILASHDDETIKKLNALTAQHQLLQKHFNIVADGFGRLLATTDGIIEYGQRGQCEQCE